MAKNSLLHPVTKDTDIVELLKVPQRRPKKAVLVQTKAGHRIQDIWNQFLKNPVPVKVLVERSNLPFDRVQEHVNHYITRRKGMARYLGNRRAKPFDGQPSNKHGVFQMFLDDPEGFDSVAVHEKYPDVKFSTIVSWESHWRNYGGNSFSGTDGFPRGSADTLKKIARIKNAIKRARRARGTGKGSSRSRRRTPPEQNFPDEIPIDRAYVEGAVSNVMVNRYERDPRARAACLRKFGCSCAVCAMSFQMRYGEIGIGFIHVHHRQPLALRKAEYQLNPSKDLVPVCPNCHAMLHTSDPPLEIEELREIWRKHDGGEG